MLRLRSGLRHLRATSNTRGSAWLLRAEMPRKAGATTKGGKSREKVVKLLASTTPEEILEKLKKEAKKT
uniref:Chromosome 15 open reading frame 40 n=1 Tax=Gorilla gorilla gorilla TaxID=9595 RepID=A0A2I2YQM1_GORGO